MQGPTSAARVRPDNEIIKEYRRIPITAAVELDSYPEKLFYSKYTYNNKKFTG
jgi:hypothetical protein